MKLTIIVPVLNEQEMTPVFYSEVTSMNLGVELELLYVDDGSTDATLSILQRLCEEDPRVRYLSFSRNFGKEAAIYAGLQHATGDLMCVMDVDLQAPPALQPQMISYIRDAGYDIDVTCRKTRKGEPWLRSWFAHKFYQVINRMSKTEIVEGARDYQMMTRQVADSILQLAEYNRFSKGIFGWVGFRRQLIAYDNVERSAGQSKWNLWSLFAYAIEGIVAFSTVPLVVASLLGILLCLGAIVAIVLLIIRTKLYGDPTSGWPSMVCIITLLAGLQLFFLGVIGQYLAKTYMETKRRPVYILREKK